MISLTLYIKPGEGWVNLIGPTQSAEASVDCCGRALSTCSEALDVTLPLPQGGTAAQQQKGTGACQVASPVKRSRYLGEGSCCLS